MDKLFDVEFIKSEWKNYIAGMSVDCTIFAFNDGELKILLCRPNGFTKWLLPGGFIRKDEDVDSAANNILTHRTGLVDVYLKQFHLFGEKDRIDIEENRRIAETLPIGKEYVEWFAQRFITIGYYAFVEFKKARINTLADEDVAWFSVDNLVDIEFYADHRHIIEVSLCTLRAQLGSVPIGYELLPERFTMPELRSIYETILGYKTDRRNFQRKMLSSGIINCLKETRKIGAHKSPKLYSFDKEKYLEALKYGFQRV